MKPFVNLDELDNYIEHEKGPYKEKYAPIAEKIGAKKLGYSLSVVPPGKKSCPFHNHRVAEEMFLIIEGTGLLRFGDKEYPLKKHDLIACPPGDRSVAHQIINTGSTDLRYLCLGTNEDYDVCEYPDSNKVMTYSADRSFRHISKADQTLNYYDGEL